MYLSFKILLKLKIENAAFVIPFIFLMPLNFQIEFSSFTEPLFAVFLLIGILLCIDKKYLTAAIVISFLPMVRSEGLIMFAAFGLYFLLQKQFKSLVFLFFGQLFYSLIGWIFIGKSFLWVIGEIPYAQLDSPYGNGPPIHFAEQIYYICGLPLCILFGLGLIGIVLQWKKLTIEFKTLILGGFLFFFIFHSISWYYGIFNSMGLKRVFGAVIPLMAILMIIGLNIFNSQLIPIRIGKPIKWVFLLASVGFLFTSGPAAVKWKKEMSLSPPQEMANEVGNFIFQEKLPFNRFVYADRYLAESLNIDPYNPDQFALLNNTSLDHLKSGDLIIWDNWHAPVDFGIQLEDLNQNSKLTLLEEFINEEHSRKVHYAIFSIKE